MYVNPVCNYVALNNVQKIKKNPVQKNQNLSYKGREEYIVSSHSQKLLDNIFHALYKAQQELGETKILTRGYEVTHKYPQKVNINMRKYDPNTDTLIRLDNMVNGTALQVHIDKFREEEFIRFMVQMKDLKDQNGNVHLSKGNVNEFHWVQNFVDRSERIQEIDTFIDTYLK